MSLVVPDPDLSKSGKRIQAFPSALSQSFDAFDRLIVREKDGGKWWIPLNGYLSPVVPILLQFAVPTGDVLPVLVKLPADRWLQCMWTWLQDQKKIRKDLGKRTGIYTWRKRADASTALARVSDRYAISLRIWLTDEWCWKEEPS